MKNGTDINDPKLRGFIGFIPKPLELADKEPSFLPLNVLIGRYTIRNGKKLLGSVLYEPDSSTLTIDNDGLFMLYRNRYDHRYFLKLSVDKLLLNRKCEKYKETKPLGSAEGIIDLKNKDKSWSKFFIHVAMLGLDDGEICEFTYLK